MKAFTLEINGEAEYIWYCKECDCYYMNPFWRNGEKRILDVYHKVPVRRLIKQLYSFDYDLPIAEKQSAFLFPSNTFCVCSYHFIYHSSIKNDR